MLRDAGPADAARIAALHAASWRDAYRGVLSDGLLDHRLEAAMRADWTAKLSARPLPGAVLIAERAGAPAGFIAVWRRGALAYVDNLHVRPGLRGAGLGRTLLAEGARRMQALGCTQAALDVFAANAGAIRFYGRLGAVIGPVVQAEVHGEAVSEQRCHWSDIAVLVGAAIPQA